MIQVRYFARLREELNCESESLEQVADIRTLMKQLAARGGKWAEFFAEGELILVSVNHEMADPGVAITDGDEVAFFPPVTGG
ncbi:MAG: MoaD/ThiS family protein [Gammaproteobacteria bacterium]|nr:MoaD/ThiS family protein [Gammaproteobacteria bacterium]